MTRSRGSSSRGRKKRSTSRGTIRRSAYERAGYTRRDGVKVKATHVPSTMIKDRGKPGKGPKIIKVTGKTDLKAKGYKLSETAAERQKAIRSAVREYGKLKTLHKLNALRTLNKSNETAYKKLDRDVEYVQSL